MAYNNSQPQKVPTIPDLATMQEQLNQIQQMFQKMTQSIGVGQGAGAAHTFSPTNQGYGQQFPNTQMPAAQFNNLNGSTVQLMQEMLSSIQKNHASQVNPSAPVGKPGNVQQMMAMLQHNPQMLQALIAKTQSHSKTNQSQPLPGAKNVLPFQQPNADMSLPPPSPSTLPPTFSLPPSGSASFQPPIPNLHTSSSWPQLSMPYQQQSLSSGVPTPQIALPTSFSVPPPMMLPNNSGNLQATPFDTSRPPPSVLSGYSDQSSDASFRSTLPQSSNTNHASDNNRMDRRWANDNRQLGKDADRQRCRDDNRRYGRNDNGQADRDDDRQRGRDAERQSGKDDNRPPGRDNDRQYGKDYDRQHGRDADRQPGRHGERPRGKGDDKQYGGYGEKQHGRYDDKQSNRDNDESRRYSNESRQGDRYSNKSLGKDGDKDRPGDFNRVVNNRSGNRNDGRNDGRNEIRDRSRDNFRNQPRDDSRGQPRDDSRGQPRDDSRGQPRDDSRSRSRDDSRSRQRDDRNWQRDGSGGQPRDSNNMQLRDDSKSRPTGDFKNSNVNNSKLPWNRSRHSECGSKTDSLTPTVKQEPIKVEPMDSGRAFSASSHRDDWQSNRSRSTSSNRLHNRNQFDRSEHDNYRNPSKTYAGRASACPARPKYPVPREKPKQYQNGTPSPSKESTRGAKRSSSTLDNGAKAGKSMGKPGSNEGWSAGDKTKAKRTSVLSDSDFSSDSCSSGFSSDDDDNRKGDSKAKHLKEEKVKMEDLYGAYDERAIRDVESTQLPDYIESTPAGKYLTRDPETGSMVATTAFIELEDQFERDVLKRAARAREGRSEYKYPERTARLACCKKTGCAHESEEDDTDESDLEEGELEDDSDEDNKDGSSDRSAGSAAKKTGMLSAEVLAKINHPERLHKFLCFNDKGETNYGPLCKCSRKARRIGVRHGFYAGETMLKKCEAESSNVGKLFHYRLSLSPLFNFKVSDATSILWDDRQYIFDGFSFLTHTKIEREVLFKTILYNSYYTIKLAEETMPTMFTTRSLDLVTDYLFKELFEIADLTWVQDAFKDGCRQIHVMPRFTRTLPDNGMEVLAMPHIMKYLLDNSHPMIQDDQLAAVASMDKKVWEEKIVKKYQFTLVTIPGMRPSTLRVDNMDRPEQNSLVIRYPQVLHFVKINENLAMPDNEQCQKLFKKKRRIHKLLGRRTVQQNSEKYHTELKMVQRELHELKMKSSETGEGCASREPLIELSSQGFFATGLKCDVTQWALIMPKVLDNVRFIQSLCYLQKDMGYEFRNPFYLQLALTHPSYISCSSLNQDHIRNSQTNCGLRRLTYGHYPVYKELRVKKKGLKTLLEIMSLKYRQYTGPIYSYERLEFLGDAVLEFITTVHLYYTFPKLEEGGLATFRTAIIKNEHLTSLAKILGIQHYVLYAHGLDLCSSIQFDHTLANAFEAILGAIFLDGGIDKADQFLSRCLAKSLDFKEFTPCWTDLPLHPLQDLYPEGDRNLVEGTPALQKCTDFENQTGLKFDNVCILARALTHTSMGYLDFAQGSNQTLEFLGDSILQLIVSDYLFKKYANHHEGHLTLLRSSLVNNLTQAEIFKDLGIGKFVFRKLTTPIQTKERADYVEALIGALYVDQGIASCKAFCKILFFPRLKDTIESQNWNDAKSLLQQCCLELRDASAVGEPDLPTYKVVGQHGPTHSRRFKVAVYFKGLRIGVGEDSSIQRAQFEAAQNALDTNREMFPMLQPGTNKFITRRAGERLKSMRSKAQSRDKRRQKLDHMESYWN